MIENLCIERQVSYLFKDKYMEQENDRLLARGERPRSIGSTELGRIIAASNGLVDGTTIQVPTTDYHTMDESASWESIDAFINLLSSLADEIKS